MKCISFALQEIVLINFGTLTAGNISVWEKSQAIYPCLIPQPVLSKGFLFITGKK